MQSYLRTHAARLGKTWLFRPYFYAILLLALLPFCLRDRVLLALSLSAIAGEGALFFLAPTPDFRYSIWMVTTSLLALVIVIARLARRRLLRRADEAG